MSYDYQAIFDAASLLYVAMQDVERRLAEVVDANASREAMRLTNTRLAIQKLLAVYQYAPPAGFTPKAPALPPTPGDTLAYKPTPIAAPVVVAGPMPSTAGATLAAKPKPKGRR